MSYWDNIQQNAKKGLGHTQDKDKQRSTRYSAWDVGPGGSQMGMTDFKGNYAKEDMNEAALHPTFRTEYGGRLNNAGGQNYAGIVAVDTGDGILGGSDNTGGSAGGGSRRYGGGYGGGYGGSAINMDQIIKLLGRKPHQHTAMQVPEYSAPEFYDFDAGVYDQARKALAQGLAADQARGGTAYGDARTELAALQAAGNPYERAATQQTAGVQPISGVLARYGGQVDTSGAEAGNAAFDQARSLMAGAHGQRMAAEGRALAGDERRFGETLANQGRMYGQSIEMAQAKARAQYDQDAWRYGVEVADKMYEQRMAQAQADHSASTANVNAANEYTSGAINTLINLISGGQKIDPATLEAFLDGGAA